MTKLERLIGGGILTIVLMAVASGAIAQPFFNYWSRCTNVKISPDRRVSYCTRLLNDGGGPNSEIAVLTVLGGVYQDLHDYAKAVDAYSRAIRFESLGVSDSHVNSVGPGVHISVPTADILIGALEARAEVYALTGRQDLALDDTAHIFKLAPDAATSRAIRCRIRAILKSDLDKARADCSNALTRDPKNTQVLGAAGFLQYRLGDLKEAADDFDRSLRINPRLAGALYMRGIIAARNGDAAAAKADLAAAAVQDPGVAESFADLGIRP